MHTQINGTVQWRRLIKSASFHILSPKQLNNFKPLESPPKMIFHLLAKKGLGSAIHLSP